MNSNYSDVFLAISSNNVRALTGFYSKLFGQQPNVYRASVYSEFRLEKLRISIFQPKSDRASEFENSRSSISLCIEVKKLEDAIALLQDLGCPPPGEIIEASHGKEIYAYDPEGNRLILHQSK